jgi:hypothetical protein
MVNRAEDLQGIQEFEQRLQTAGVRGALRFLNGRTRYRFTGIYRFDGQEVQCVALFDRENPRVRTRARLTGRDGQSAVADHGAPFFEKELASGRAAADKHSARASLISYQSVPLRDESNGFFGLLCHWDVWPRLVPDGEIEFLSAVAPMIATAVRPTPVAAATQSIDLPAAQPQQNQRDARL